MLDEVVKRLPADLLDFYSIAVGNVVVGVTEFGATVEVLRDERTGAAKACLSASGVEALAALFGACHSVMAPPEDELLDPDEPASSPAHPAGT